MVVAPSQAAVRIVSGCSSLQEFLTVFRPLCRGDVLFVPTDASVPIGMELEFSMSLATGDPVLRGAARVVDPFAHGLSTGGYTGMALELGRLSSDSRRTLEALRSPAAGTLPFGVPTGGGGTPRDRVKCEVAMDPRRAVPQAISDGPSTQVARPATPAPPPPPEPAPALDMGWSPEHGDAEEPTDAEPARDQLPDLFPPPPRSPTPPPQPAAGPAKREPSFATPAPVTAAPSEPIPRLESRDPSKTEIVVGLPAASRSIWVPGLVATLAVCLGLGAGYLLWGRPQSGPTAVPRAARAAPAARPSAADPPAATRPAPSTVVPAAAAAGECRAELGSDPAGAAVFLDGALVGATPYAGPVPCGSSRVALRLPRYENADFVLEATPGTPAEAQRTLARPTVTLRVTSRPRRATVYVAGKRVGRTPVTARVPAFDAVEVKVVRRGYEAHVETITPEKRRTTLSVRLKR